MVWSLISSSKHSCYCFKRGDKNTPNLIHQNEWTKSAILCFTLHNRQATCVARSHWKPRNQYLLLQVRISNSEIQSLSAATSEKYWLYCTITGWKTNWTWATMNNGLLFIKHILLTQLYTIITFLLHVTFCRIWYFYCILKLQGIDWIFLDLMWNYLLENDDEMMIFW